MSVFFYEVFAEEAELIRRFLPPDIRADYTEKTIQEHAFESVASGRPGTAGIPPSVIISIRTQSIIPPDWSDHIEAILTRSTGYDHITAYRSEVGRPIPAGYLPLYCNRAVAEQALMMWLGLCRKLSLQLSQFHAFHRNGLTGTETQGKTLVVVGVGRIGREVVEIGQGLGMRVIGVDIDEREPDVDYLDLENALSMADIVVCAMNLTSENREYFSYNALKKTRAGTIFVNVSRGELSSPSILLQLLEESHLGGVGLDVYNQESRLAVRLRGGWDEPHSEVEATLELAKRTDVILTPHNAFNTTEAVERKARQSVEQVQRFLETGRFIWEVPG